MPGNQETLDSKELREIDLKEFKRFAEYRKYDAIIVTKNSSGTEVANFKRLYDGFEIKQLKPIGGALQKFFGKFKNDKNKEESKVGIWIASDNDNRI